MLSLCLAGLLMGFQAGALPVITSPAGGEAVRGQVSVAGTSAAAGFLSSEVSFGYMDDETHTWFLITQGEQPVTAGEICNWDTTRIPDGTYRLRLRVFLQGGGMAESVVEGIRVRNYSPVETSTPALTPAAAVTLQVTPTAAKTIQPTVIAMTATPFSPNPMTLTWDDLQTSMKTGVIVACGALLVLGILFAARASSRRRGG